MFVSGEGSALTAFSPDEGTAWLRLGTVETTDAAPKSAGVPTAKRRRRDFGVVGVEMKHRAATALGRETMWFDSVQLAAFDVIDSHLALPAKLSYEACAMRADDLITEARAPSTRRSYIGYWCVFVHFLISMVPQEFVSAEFVVTLPVTVQTVTAWVGFLSWLYAPTTIDIALASINLVHEYWGVASPTSFGRVRAAVEGASRLWSAVSKVKWVLLPKHVRAAMSVIEVRSGRDCEGSLWSQDRLHRAQNSMSLGYVAFLRKGELLALDLCDMELIKDGQMSQLELIQDVPDTDEGFDCAVRKAKNDPAGRGRTACVGNQWGDGSGFRERMNLWIAKLLILRSGPCTKRSDPKSHCTGCGWLFPRLGGNPAKVVRDRRPRAKATTNFLSADLRQLLRQLQVNKHPAVAGTLDVKTFTPVCLRRAANSVSAAENVHKAIRQVQGRWNGPETHDQNYMFVHRSQFTGIGSLLFSSEVGS